MAPALESAAKRGTGGMQQQRGAESVDKDAAAAAAADEKVRKPKSRGAKKAADPMVYFMYFGLVIVIACVMVGVGLSQKHVDKAAHPWPGRPSVCLLSRLGYETGIFTKPWVAAQPQWLMGLILALTFIARKYAFEPLAAYLYGDLPRDKQVKICNYMLEIVGETAALAECSYVGYWGLLFNRHQAKYQPPLSPEVSSELATGLQLLVSFFLSTYILELAMDRDMRFGLALHHWVSIVLVLWCVLAAYYINYDVLFLRVAFVFSLYMSTEQTVFIELLFYHKHYEQPFWYYASAYYYALSRLAIMGLSLWTWWQAYDVVFKSGLHNNVIVYSLWCFTPAANLILNATQSTTVFNLFGIAAKVRARSRAAQQNDQVRVALMDVFQSIDFDGGGSIDSDEFVAYCEELHLPFAFPRDTMAAVYAAVDTDGAGGIDSDEFVDYFRDKYDVALGFPFSLQVELVQVMAASHADDAATLQMLHIMMDALLRKSGAAAQASSRADSVRLSAASMSSKVSSRLSSLLKEGSAAPAEGGAAVTVDVAALEQRERFTRAAEEAKRLPVGVSNDDLLAMYGLYKQANLGDNVTPKPGALDPRAAAKWRAWTQCRGLEAEQAMEEYTDLVATLRAKYNSAGDA